MVFVVARMKRVAVAARILFRLLNELMSYIFLILDLYRGVGMAVRGVGMVGMAMVMVGLKLKYRYPGSTCYRVSLHTLCQLYIYRLHSSSVRPQFYLRIYSQVILRGVYVCCGGLYGYW